jgi:hypothetical protein
MSVSCECCVFSSRRLCVGLITRPEESYRVWCAWVWSWNLDNVEALPHQGLSGHGKKKLQKGYGCIAMSPSPYSSKSVISNEPVVTMTSGIEVMQCC